ncbi:MAG TPA: hypothetical protein VF297_06155 [Pyrinomonadaceae bacterium]
MRRSPGSRTFIVVLLALCAAARAASGQQAGAKINWQEFRSEAGGFSVKFPSAPRVSKVPMVRGPVTLTRNVHGAVAGGGVYEFEVDYVDMPAGYSEPELSLEGGISGFIRFAESRGGRVLTNVKVVRGTCEGREATATAPAPPGRTGFAHGRVFYSGQRYYFALFHAREDNAAARAVGRVFMDSLDIKDGCKAPIAPTPAPTAPPVRGTVEGTPDAATGWRRIDLPDLGLSMLMPGPAQRETTQTQVQPFAAFHHEFVFETDEIIYTAEVLGDFPIGFYSTPVSQEGLLDITLAAVKKNFGELGFVYGEPRKLNAGAYPAREYVMTSEKTGSRGRLRLYATPRRAYVFLVLVQGTTPRDAEVERFLSSIRISPK